MVYGFAGAAADGGGGGAGGSRRRQTLSDAWLSALGTMQQQQLLIRLQFVFTITRIQGPVFTIIRIQCPTF